MAYLSASELVQVWGVRTDVLSAITKTMAEFQVATGKTTRVGDDGGVRSPARQAAIRADSVASGFRAAPAGESPHEYGAAVDLIIQGTGDDAATDAKNPLYETLARIAEKNGLRAGLRFKSGLPDPYHFEAPETLAVWKSKWAALTRGRLWRAAILAGAVMLFAFGFHHWRRRRGAST